MRQRGLGHDCALSGLPTLHRYWIVVARLSTRRGYAACIASDVPIASPLARNAAARTQPADRMHCITREGSMIYQRLPGARRRHVGAARARHGGDSGARPRRARRCPATARCARSPRPARCSLLAALTHRRPPFRHRQRHGRATRRRSRCTRKSCTHDAVRDAAAFPQGHAGSGAARADRRADVGTLRDAAARHRADDAAPTTTSTSPTGTTRATCRSPPAASVSTNTSSTSSTSSASIGPGAHLMAICQPCVAALAAVAIMSEDEHPATPGEHDADGGPDRLPHRADDGQQARHRQADRMVRART